MHYQDLPLTDIKRLYTSPLIKIKIVSEINDTEELSEGIFHITLN